MSYNGSGTFNINTAGQPVVAGTTITASAFNALTADLATGLSTAITKDGQTTVIANIPMGGYKITNLGAAVSGTDAAQYKQIQTNTTNFMTVLGTDTLIGTTNPVLEAYAAGNIFYFLPVNTNTGAVTVNISGLGAKAITKNGTTALSAGDLTAGQANAILYDGTQFQLLTDPFSSNVGTAGQVLTSNGTSATPSFQTLSGFTSGMLMPYAGSSAPTGWLLCYGQAVSRTTYASLFAVISTTYGSGDGSTTFNLPDLRGRSIFGQDNMGGSAASRLTTAGSGVDGATLGASGGNQALASHTHTYSGTSGSTTITGSFPTASNVNVPGGAYSGVFSQGTSYGGNGGNAQDNYIVNMSAPHTHTYSGTTASSGTGSSANIPPAIVATYIIKT